MEQKPSSKASMASTFTDAESESTSLLPSDLTNPLLVNTGAMSDLMIDTETLETCEAAHPQADTVLPLLDTIDTTTTVQTLELVDTVDTLLPLTDMVPLLPSVDHPWTIEEATEVAMIEEDMLHEVDTVDQIELIGGDQGMGQAIALLET